MQEHTVAYIGNFRPPHSTENDVRDALEQLGHTVIKIQEDSPEAWEHLRTEVQSDLVLWTRTWTMKESEDVIPAVKRRGMAVVGFHLDRWWGLSRERQIFEEPYFALCDLMVTADGGNADKWRAANVEHLWMPPAVTNRAGRGKPQTQFVKPLAFVGSWRNYHPEWEYRKKLIEFLSSRYGRDFKVWPRSNQQIRGRDLEDLYASVKLVVGDSCLAGGATHYWSDRIPETLGRGGLLIHPEVDGLADQGFIDGETLITYRQTDDFSHLQSKINEWLKNPYGEHVAQNGMDLVHRLHTYNNRMSDLLTFCRKNGYMENFKNASGIKRVSSKGAVATFDLRPNTDDGVVIDEVWNEGVYRLGPTELKGRSVLDIGANCGAFSLYAEACGATQVIAFEPHPDNCAILCRNIALNNSEVEPIQAAVTAEDGVVAFSDHVKDGDRTYTGSSQVSDTGFDVVAMSMKTALKMAKGTNVIIKMDIEGGEYEAFNSINADDLVNVERIVMEFHGVGTNWKSEVDAFGSLVAKLAEWGHVETLGRPSNGGMIYAKRYQ